MKKYENAQHYEPNDMKNFLIFKNTAIKSTIFLLKCLLFYFFITFLLNSCSTNEEVCDGLNAINVFCERIAAAKLSVKPGSGEDVYVGQQVFLDASESIYDDIDWFIDGNAYGQCHLQKVCVIKFDTSGPHDVQIKVKVDQTGQLLLGLTGHEETQDDKVVTIYVKDEPEEPDELPAAVTPTLFSCIWGQSTSDTGWINGLTALSSVTFNSKIWAIGGIDWFSIPKNWVWSFSSGSSWTQVTANASWNARSGHTSVVFEDKMWVIGGANVNAEVWYSDDGATWTAKTLSAPWSARRNHTSVVFNNKMWVIGGFDGNQKNDVWYSSDGATWVLATVNAEWNARSGHTSIVFNNRIWVIGGTIGNSGFKNDVWYSSDGIKWTQAVNEASWAARRGHTAAVIDSRMWIIGGYNTTWSSDVWYSNDGTNWHSSSSGNWAPRTDHASTVFGGQIWVIGGQKPDGVKKDVWSCY
ncbi:MAG: hypothetical protein HQM14_00045 [SAR324 cluster bacterium]|nr:hypothetical protein [SAR324 cluster bacterium]